MKLKDKLQTKKLMAAVAVGVIAFGTVGVMPAMATSNPTIHKIVHAMGIDKDLTPYESIVGKSVTKEGLTMMINEVIVDNDQIMASVIATSEESLVDRYAGPAGFLTINGQKINKGTYANTDLIDDYTAHTVLVFPLDEQLEGELDIKLQLTTPFFEMERSPHWNYEFTAIGENLAAQTITHDINQETVLADGTKVTLEKYTTNPFNDRIYFQVEGEDHDNIFHIVGKDQDGQEVKFAWRMMSDNKGDMRPEEGYTDIVQNATELTLSLYSNDQAIGEEFVIKK